MFKLYFEDSGLVYPLPSSTASLSPGLPMLHSSIFLSTFSSYLLLYVIAKSLLSAFLCLLLSFLSYLSVSFTHPLLSLSVSLFCDCSGWSPCGTPCRVPNLFIISALCRDAWGMLKYTPPRSGYKWAGVPPSSPPAPTAQPTRPLGWTDLTSQTQTLKMITTPRRRRLCTSRNLRLMKSITKLLFLECAQIMLWIVLFIFLEARGCITEG